MDLTEIVSATLGSDEKCSLQVLHPGCVVAGSQVYRFVGKIKQNQKVTTAGYVSL